MKIKQYIIGILIILVDQISKLTIIDKEIIIIPKIMSLTYTKNFGGAFSIGNNKIVLILSIILILGIITLLMRRKDRIDSLTPYILIISGSIGNLIDRICRGYVIDFFDIKLFNFPVFNISDMCIVYGILYLAFIIIKKILNSNDKF